MTMLPSMLEHFEWIRSQMMYMGSNLTNRMDCIETIRGRFDQIENEVLYIKSSVKFLSEQCEHNVVCSSGNG